LVNISENQLRLYLYNPEKDKPQDENMTSLDSSDFRAEVYGPHYYSLQIHRKEGEKTLLFSTSQGPTIASENYWELSLQFPKGAALFGAGGLRLSSKPKLLYNTEERLGANPFIIILDAEVGAYGILFSNPGPLEFQLLEDPNILLVKSLSIVMWNISVFSGPTPARVMEQYTSSGGRRPILPPPWALGLHVCRNMMTGEESLAADDARQYMENATNFPYDSDCLQERLLYQFDFQMPEVVKNVEQEFKQTGRRLLLSLPPQVRNGAEFNNTLPYVRSEVFTAVTMNNGVFWDITPCGSCKNRRFGGT
jgi:alpha-glucosidase (family GH31 glycosyl hydrolase)